MEKLEQDLVEDVRLAAIDLRLETIRRGNSEEQQRFFQELATIAGNLVDNVEPIPLRERVVGYESVILWVALSAILFVVTRYWADVRDFLFQAFQTIIQNTNQVVINSINFERIQALTYELYNHPATQDAVMELVTRGNPG